MTHACTPKGVKEFRMPSNCPLSRCAARWTTLSPDGGEGVKSTVTFPSPQRGEGPGVRGSAKRFVGTNSFTSSLQEGICLDSLPPQGWVGQSWVNVYETD